MKERIHSLKPKEEPISDLDASFGVIYNLLAEKIDKEPKKGIILSKGNPNQRKVTWVEAMRIAHMLEDYFIFQKQLTGCNTCECCVYWKSISEASPHMGRCVKRKKEPVHKFSSCKKFERIQYE